MRTEDNPKNTNTAVNSQMVVCIAEDRLMCEPSLRLLLMSLQQHCRHLGVELFYPPANEEFRKWLQQFPQVRLNRVSDYRPWSWNVKPYTILTLLKRGYNNVLWIDSDIIITKNFEALFQGLSDDTLSVTEDALYGTADTNGLRAQMWGLKVGRPLPFTANTGVIRATKKHENLLRDWITLLEDPRYQNAQRNGINNLDIHLLGDQDVLTALLASEKHSHVPIKFLYRGSDIIQYYGPCGYTLWERMYHLFHGLPPFIHSQVNKPWWITKDEKMSKSIDRSFNRLLVDLSPYTITALKYRHTLTNWSWMKTQTKFGWLFRVIGGNHPTLTGLPLSLIADLVRLIKWGNKKFKTQKSLP